MKDLTDTFSEHNIKVPNTLLYADDVTLMAEYKSDFQRILNIASLFSTKWNIKFNLNP
jgi:hypothetical protein